MTWLAAFILLAARSANAIDWVTIPAGSFQMGARDLRGARPVHRVSLKAFQLARTLVTNKQYRACVLAQACTPPSPQCLEKEFTGDDQPVTCVDWQQARAFCAWVGARLPTEAEWEYAARGAGKDRAYPWGGEKPTCDRAVISQRELDGNGCGRNATWPVCSKPLGNTPQGLCDMAGDVWEWVQDVYHESYDGAPSDGTAWETPPGNDHVNRGGSWRLDGTYSRAAARGRSGPGIVAGDDYLGFRPARSVPAGPSGAH